MAITEGQYIVKRFRGAWQVFKAVNVRSDGYNIVKAEGEPIFHQREDTVKCMYKLNGWRYKG